MLHGSNLIERCSYELEVKLCLLANYSSVSVSRTSRGGGVYTVLANTLWMDVVEERVARCALQVGARKMKFKRGLLVDARREPQLLWGLLYFTASVRC